MITTALLVGLGIFTVLMVVIGFLTYQHSRKVLRVSKNFERGLKMVPLYIHLPPMSEDSDQNGRDERDLTEENISKAQVLYTVLNTIAKKGRKHSFYGQRHIAFEIIATGGFVKFFVAVPVSLIELVQQAVVSAYPTARLEEAPEHNIFNEQGKLGGTMGGELVLKEKFAFPIATYQDIKRDAMQSILNALSTLDKEDGASIQLLLRPARTDWRKTITTLVGDKKKGKDKKKAGALLWSMTKEVATTIANGNDSGGKDGGKKEPKELSNLEMSVLDAMEEKTRHPGYETLIRVVTSSNVSQRAQTSLNNIVASFALFDAQGKNGFKFSAAKDMSSFITSYLLRFFPQDYDKNILNAVELATIFHFPDQRSIPTTQLERQASKQVDGPRNMPEEGMLLGYNLFRGAKKPVRLSTNDRRRHLYAVGQTGTGKSTFLENLALQDMLAGRGFAFVDPHGDTAEKLLEMVPPERSEDVIYFCPADMEYPLGLNLFEFHDEDQKDFLIQETINMLYKLYDPQHQGIIGPRYESLFRHAALTVMADPAGGTFIDIPKLFNDPDYVKQKLQHVTDPTVRDFWLKEMPASQRSNDFGEVKSWFVSKFGAFLSNQMMRNIIGQTKSAFDLRDIMDNNKILLVNLSKGRTGDLNSKLLGMIFVMKFQAAAMSRADTPEEDRIDFSLYVDEFQNFSTESFATILSEARKYRLNLIVANQFTTQLTDEIRDAVFGNVGSIVAFRIGQNDVEALQRYYQPFFDGDDLLRLPNYNAAVRTLVGGVPTQPFSMAALPPLGSPNKELGTALKQLSAAKHGRARAHVEAEIFKRLSDTSPAATPAASQPPVEQKSFVDSWLQKRTDPNAKSVAPPAQPAAPAAQPAYSQPQPMSTSQPQQPTFAQPAPGFGAQPPLQQQAAGQIAQYQPAPATQQPIAQPMIMQPTTPASMPIAATPPPLVAEHTSNLMQNEEATFQVDRS